MTDYKPLSGRWHGNRYGVSHSKLSARDVLEIRRLSRAGWTSLALAQRYHVAYQTVWEIVERRSWTRLPSEPVYWTSRHSSVWWSWWLTIWIFLSLCRVQQGVGVERGQMRLHHGLV